MTFYNIGKNKTRVKKKKYLSRSWYKQAFISLNFATFFSTSKKIFVKYTKAGCHKTVIYPKNAVFYCRCVIKVDFWIKSQYNFIW